MANQNNLVGGIAYYVNAPLFYIFFIQHLYRSNAIIYAFGSILRFIGRFTLMHRVLDYKNNKIRHKLKKLERIKLSTLSSEVNVLGKSESANIIGGQYMGSDGNTYYTGSEMETMMDNGTWTGGFVDGMGYMGSVVDVVDVSTLYVTKGKGQKLQLVYNYLMANKEFIDQYDYFFFPDDDIRMDETIIVRLFKMMEEYSLAIAQPALVNSYFTYPQTLKQPGKVLRFNNFVEMMVPCFSRDALKKVLFTFKESKSSWGANHHWAQLVQSEKYNMAILDDVAIVHNQPVHSVNEENRGGMFDYFQKHSLSGKIIQYN